MRNVVVFINILRFIKVKTVIIIINILVCLKLKIIKGVRTLISLTFSKNNLS